MTRPPGPGGATSSGWPHAGQLLSKPCARLESVTRAASTTTVRMRRDAHPGTSRLTRRLGPFRRYYGRVGATAALTTGPRLPPAFRDSDEPTAWCVVPYLAALHE